MKTAQCIIGISLNVSLTQSKDQQDFVFPFQIQQVTRFVCQKVSRKSICHHDHNKQ